MKIQLNKGHSVKTTDLVIDMELENGVIWV